MPEPVAELAPDLVGAQHPDVPGDPLGLEFVTGGDPRLSGRGRSRWLTSTRLTSGRPVSQARTAGPPVTSIALTR